MEVESIVDDILHGVNWMGLLKKLLNGDEMTACYSPQLF